MEEVLSVDQKGRLREEVWRKMREGGLCPSPEGSIPTFPGQGRAAERLRKLPEYRRARTVMVPPDQAQLQVRINALMDGKRLIVASPGLRDGFFLLSKEFLHPRRWAASCRTSDIKRMGRPLSLKEIGRIDLMATGAVAVGLDGGRVGKGSGFFDLEYMILRETGAVGERTPIVALVDDLQVYEEVPSEEKDVTVDVIITPSRTIRVRGRPQRPKGIMWEVVDRRTLRRMKPLWELSQGAKG